MPPPTAAEPGAQPGLASPASPASPAYAARDAPAAAGARAALRGPAEGAAPARKAERADEQSDEPFDAALRSYRAGRFDDATRAFDALPASDPNAPELWAARSVREGKGCGAAVGRFDRTAMRSRRTPPGWDALLEGGLCYRALGELSAARSRFTSLLDVDSHKDRARAELERIDDLQASQAVGGAPAAKAARARTATPAGAPAAAQPAAPAAPAADSSK